MSYRLEWITWSYNLCEDTIKFIVSPVFDTSIKPYLKLNQVSNLERLKQLKFVLWSLVMGLRAEFT